MTLSLRTACAPISFSTYKTTVVSVRTPIQLRLFPFIFYSLSLSLALSLQARTVGRRPEEEGGHRQCPYCDLTGRWVIGADGHIW